VPFTIHGKHATTIMGCVPLKQRRCAAQFVKRSVTAFSASQEFEYALFLSHEAQSRPPAVIRQLPDCSRTRPDTPLSPLCFSAQDQHISASSQHECYHLQGAILQYQQYSELSASTIFSGDWSLSPRVSATFSPHELATDCLYLQSASSFIYNRLLALKRCAGNTFLNFSNARFIRA
jgi:hypothetical protein